MIISQDSTHKIPRNKPAYKLTLIVKIRSMMYLSWLEVWKHKILILRSHYWWLMRMGINYNGFIGNQGVTLCWKNIKNEKVVACWLISYYFFYSLQIHKHIFHYFINTFMISISFYFISSSYNLFVIYHLLLLFICWWLLWYRRIQ